jgi:hypothetical protein
MSTDKQYEGAGRTHCLHLQDLLLDPENTGTTFVENVGNCADRQGVISQKTFPFNTAIKISNLALYSPAVRYELPNVPAESTAVIRVQIKARRPTILDDVFVVFLRTPRHMPTRSLPSMFLNVRVYVT